MLTIIVREELYTDVRLNDILCERYQVHMGQYGRKVLKRHDKVLTASSDVGMSSLTSQGNHRESANIWINAHTSILHKGNVSYVTPTLHTNFGIPTPENSFPHHPTYTAAAGTDEAHEEALIVGKSLAMIGWDMITNDALFATAHRQWKEEIERDD